MSAILMNRAGFTVPEDGFYHLAPLGEFAHAQAGILQIIDQDACVAMVNNFRQDAEAANFAGILVDFDHFSLDGEKRSEAAGWIVALEARGLEEGSDQAGKDGARGGAEGAENRPRMSADGRGSGAHSDDSGRARSTGSGRAGLWAKIRWSDLGEEAVKGGRYRFLSPVWGRAECTDLGDGRLRPLKLLNAAVTNDPNLKGMAPLSNSRTPLSSELMTDHRSLITSLQIANIGWTDEARLAALAVRKAKAAARGSTAPAAPGDKPTRSSKGKDFSRGGAGNAESPASAVAVSPPASLREILARIRKLHGLVAQKAALRAQRRAGPARAT